MTESIEAALQRSRRRDSVSPSLHQAVVAGVRREQQSIATRRRLPAGFLASVWKPALAVFSVALLLVLTVPQVDRQVPLAPVNLSQDFARLLDQRLSQPLKSLSDVSPVVDPLEKELAALQSDWHRLKPRWPWQTLAQTLDQNPDSIPAQSPAQSPIQTPASG